MSENILIIDVKEFFWVIFLNVGLTVDAAGTPSEFNALLEIFNDSHVESTFFIGVRVPSDIVKLIYNHGHEIGNHTYSHPLSFLNLTYEEKELEIKSADLFLHDVLDEKFNDVKIRGFRAPYYNFDPDIPRILENFQYSWDSTKGYFPLLDSHFKMERFGKIAELPSLFPDDITLLDRMGLNENQVLKIWKKTFDISEDTLIWGIHPYISAKNSERIKMLKHFVDYIIEKNGCFLTLSKIMRYLMD